MSPFPTCLDNMIDFSCSTNAHSAAYGINFLTHEPAGIELSTATPASKKRMVCYLSEENAVCRSKRMRCAPTVPASSSNTKAEQHIEVATATAVSDSHREDDNPLRSAENSQQSSISTTPACNISCEHNDSFGFTPATSTKRELSYMEDPGLRHRSKCTQREQAVEHVRKDGVDQGSSTYSAEVPLPNVSVTPSVPVPSRKAKKVSECLSGTSETPSHSSCSSRPLPPDFVRGRSSAKNTKLFEAVSWNKYTFTPRATSTKQKHALKKPPAKSSKDSNTPVTPKTCIKRCPRTKAQRGATSHSRDAMPGMTLSNSTRVADPVKGKMADGGIIVGTRRGVFRD